jgi:hypothetical protein
MEDEAGTNHEKNPGEPVRFGWVKGVMVSGVWLDLKSRKREGTGLHPGSAVSLRLSWLGQPWALLQFPRGHSDLKFSQLRTSQPLSVC